MPQEEKVFQGAQCQEKADSVVVMMLDLFNELGLTVEEAAESAINLLIEVAGQTGVEGTASDSIVSIEITQKEQEE